MAPDLPLRWPKKERELVQWVIDSRAWNDLVFRNDDIVIVTWSKAGTTWMQQIVSQLVFKGAPDVYGPDHSPWIDFRLTPDAPAVAAAQTHRRFLKSHLPIASLVYSPKAKYIYIGRDVRDIYWSWHNHYANFTQEALDTINALPGRIGPPVGYPDPDMRIAFRRWLEQDGYPSWPFWSHVQGWWDGRNLPNLKFVHFADLKADLAGQIGDIARFLDIEVTAGTWPAIIEHCGFDYMRSLASTNEGLRWVFRQGGDTLLNRGTNGRWAETLNQDDLAFFNAMVDRHLSAECAAWLVHGVAS